MKKIMTPVVLSFLIFSCSKKNSPPIPTLKGISPMEGPATTTVTITGANFGSLSSDSVFFNGKKATITSANSTQIIVTVPLRAGTGQLSVFSNGLQLSESVFTYDTAWFVSTIAGSGTAGSLDGTGAAASFHTPAGAAFDSQGNLYITDQGNYAIRKMTPAGVVSTFAGGLGIGSNDGTGTAARFDLLGDLAIDASDNIYVADAGNNKIRKITPGGVVTTFAGSGSSTSINGTGTSASFANPFSVSIDGSGNLLVAERQAIRKVTPSGVVTTVAGNGSGTSVNGTGTAASFNYAIGSVFDKNGNLYVTESGTAYDIRKVTPGGVVTTLAGNANSIHSDGTGIAAGFNFPIGITIDNSGNLYVAESRGNYIRKITPAGEATTIAGNGNSATTDGVGVNASFNSPVGIVFDHQNNLYVIDAAGNNIRKLIWQ